MNKKILKHAALNALATVLYVAAVASFLFYAPRVVGPMPAKATVLGPIAFLLLFVFSAALTSILVFGRPAFWYFDGRKKEALALLVKTFAILFVAIIVLLATLFFVVRVQSA